MKSVSSCDRHKPPTTAMPSGWRSSAPAPAPIATGSAPKIAAKVVIMIGRKRSRQASRIAASALMPTRRRSIAKSIIMMAFFLTMPTSITMPIMAMTERSMLERHQRDERADAGRRQAGDDRDRMDEALVENAEQHIGGKDRRQHQHALPFEQILEHRGGALEAGGDGRRQPGFPLDRRDRIDRLAEREAGRQIERDGDRGLVGPGG